MSATQAKARFMKPSRPLVITGTIALVAILVMVLVDLFRPVSPQDRLRALRDEMAALRAAADSCRLVLEAEEAAIRASDARLDSLRRRIDFFESLDPRGVPSDSYDVYIRAFNEYNSRIPARAAAGDTLGAHFDSCREITERHNLVADSALDLARQLGLVREPVNRTESNAASDSSASVAPPTEPPPSSDGSGRRR